MTALEVAFGAVEVFTVGITVLVAVNKPKRKVTHVRHIRPHHPVNPGSVDKRAISHRP